jgi:hypothetical protein
MACYRDSFIYIGVPDKINAPKERTGDITTGHASPDHFSPVSEHHAG